MVGREIKGYRTSKNYRKLFELAKKQGVICICNMVPYVSRDIARTLFREEYFEVGGNGS